MEFKEIMELSNVEQRMVALKMNKNKIMETKDIKIDKIKKEVMNKFWDKINFRIQSYYDIANLHTVIVVDWHYNEIWTCTAMCIPDAERRSWDKKLIVSKLIDSLARQMTASTPKTRFGEWLVKKICKFL